MSTVDPFGQHPPEAPRTTPTPPRGRRQPTWRALVGTAVGAGLFAAGATALVTELDDAPRSADRTASLIDGAGDTADDTSAGVGSGSDGDGAGDPGTPVAGGTAVAPDWVRLAAAVGPTVVAIDVRTASGTGAGSGVLVSEDGRIVTNHHVVGGAVRGGLVVTLSDGRMFEASIVGTDPPTDLAVIRLDDPPDDLRAATLADSEDVRVGDPVAAIGNPLGLSHTVTTGIVSALDRPVTTGQAAQARGATSVTTNAIQVDAPINPGNSGGPLFDVRGRVIGINSSIASMPTGARGAAGSIGLGFAIPSNLVQLIADQLIEDGVAEHAYLGVTLGDAVAPIEDEVRAGAQVQGVEPGTPAEAAGLRPGDVVVRVDDDPVTGSESLTGVIRQHASGDRVTLTVSRDGEAVELEATLATREDVLP